MPKFRLFIAGLVVLSFLAFMPSVSHAQCGYGNGLFGLQNAYGSSGTLYGLGFVPVPPYFALHPPVYYGERYFRSYGGSPYARSGVVRRSHQVEAQIRVNPHVTRTVKSKPAMKVAKPKPAGDQMAIAPQMIINPFYQPAEKSTDRHLVKN